MTHGKLSEQRKPPARRGRTPFVEGGRPHGFAALCRHNDSALERAHLQGRLWRLLAPSPAPEPFHPRNHGEGSDHPNSAVLLRLLATKLGTFHEDRHSQHRRLATVKGEIMIMNLMCVGVILIGLALVASHYVAEGYTEKSRREPDGSRAIV